MSSRLNVPRMLITAAGHTENDDDDDDDDYDGMITMMMTIQICIVFTVDHGDADDFRDDAMVTKTMKKSMVMTMLLIMMMR
jgi:hypothetical protein